MDEMKLTVRLPAKLHAALAGAAEEDQRSLNGELVFLLTQSDRLKHWVLDTLRREKS
jgi:hypothetical protein